MVKITNGIKTFEVPSGAVSAYKTAGFKVVGKTSKKAEPKEKEPQTTEQLEQGTEGEEGENDFSELLEKPLTKWSKDEVKEFAAANGIDISGTKNANEAKDLIKAFLDGEV